MLEKALNCELVEKFADDCHCFPLLTHIFALEETRKHKKLNNISLITVCTYLDSCLSNCN